MIPKSHGCGAGLHGLLEYVTHDAPTKGERHPRTADRVGAAGLVELPPGISLKAAAKVMTATVREQGLLKALAGVSARGRPSRDPYCHVTLSWHPDERPTRPEMERAVEGALASVGLAGHQAFWVAHTDTDHFHIHIVASRICWKTGRTHKLSHEKRKLSSWARAYEEAQGEIRVETRVKRATWREERRELHAQRDQAVAAGNRIEVARLERDLVVCPRNDLTPLSVADNTAKPADCRAPIGGRCVARAEAEVSNCSSDTPLAKQREQWPRSEPVRGPGREARTDEDRAEWDQYYACARAQPDADPRALRRKRVAISKRQGRRRRLKRFVVDAAAIVSRGVDVGGRATQTTVRGVTAVAGLAALGALAGTSFLAARSLEVGVSMLAMQQMRRRLHGKPALTGALHTEGLSLRRELGAPSGDRYRAAPWSDDRMDEVERHLNNISTAPYHYNPAAGLAPQPAGLLDRLRWRRRPVRPNPAEAPATPALGPPSRMDVGRAVPAPDPPTPARIASPPSHQRPLPVSQAHKTERAQKRGQDPSRG